jgi:hypothetical protein
VPLALPPRRLIAVLALFAALPCLLLSAAACGGGSDAPDGWRSFKEGPYSGSVHRDWFVTYADFSDFDFSSLPTELPQSFRDTLLRFQASGELRNVFIVFLDRDEAFATNINILPCEAQDSISRVASTTDIVKLYADNFIEAKPIDTVRYDGREFDLLQLFLVPQFDSYQVYLETDGCYMAATLTTRSGDSAQVEQFRRFLERLKVDTSRLR